MSTRKLYWSREKNIFGTTVQMVTKDKTLSVKVAENMEFDQIKRLDSKLKEGFFFRSPNMDADLWPLVFESLNMIEGKVNLWVEQDKSSKKFTGYACVQDKMDAGMFAFANVEHWQKWSDAQQEEAKAEAKRKPQKIKINKDGTVTVKVTATTLSDNP